MSPYSFWAHWPGRSNWVWSKSARDFFQATLNKNLWSLRRKPCQLNAVNVPDNHWYECNSRSVGGPMYASKYLLCFNVGFFNTTTQENHCEQLSLRLTTLCMRATVLLYRERGWAWCIVIVAATGHDMIKARLGQMEIEHFLCEIDTRLSHRILSST